MGEHEASSGRPSPGWRVAIAALVVATAAAGAGGYWLGRQTADDDAAVVAATEDTDGDTAGGTEQGDVEQGDVEQGGAGPAGPGTGAGAGGMGGPARGEPVEGRSTVRALLARNAADGTLVRAVEVQWDTTATDGAPEPAWVPPRECQSVGNLEISLTSDAYGAMGWSDVFAGRSEPAEIWGAGWTGHQALGAFLFAAVRTSGEVAAVRLLHDGTVVDEAEPADGWAIVAAQLPPTASTGIGPDGVPDVDADVQVVSTDGTVGPRRPAFELDVPYERPECQPPPPGLPDDVRPATDADQEAVKEIAAAYAGAFNRQEDGRVDPRPHLQHADRIDDAFLDGLREQVSDLGITAITVKITETGFIDETTALVVFQLDGAPIGWLYGEAVEVDGAWKVSAQTWCSLIGRAGATCPASMWNPDQGAARYDPWPATPLG